MQGLCRARVDPAAVKTAASAFSCKATTPRLHAPHVLTPTSTCRMAAAQQEAAQLSGVHSLATLLTDAHCHPQLDPANMSAVLQLKASRLAAMSVSYDVDWKLMQQLHQMAGAKHLVSAASHSLAHIGGHPRLWHAPLVGAPACLTHKNTHILSLLTLLSSHKKATRSFPALASTPGGVTFMPQQ